MIFVASSTRDTRGRGTGAPQSVPAGSTYADTTSVGVHNTYEETTHP